jgi:hypothetical protein
MPNSDQAVFHCPGRAAAGPGSKPVCGEPDWNHDEHDYPVSSLKPTHGRPHDSESLDGCEGIGWDLSWGFRLNVGHDTADDPNSPLTIGACFSDADQARGIVVRETTPEQLEEFARLLLTIAAKQRARTTPPVAYVDSCPDSGPHLWVGRDGRPPVGDETDRCDVCGAHRSTVTRPSLTEGDVA